MTFCQFAVRIAALAAISTWAISDPCFAQRGRGGGGGGGGDGAKQSSGGDSGRGPSLSGPSGGSQMKSSGSSQMRSSSGTRDGAQIKSFSGNRDGSQMRSSVNRDGSQLRSSDSVRSANRLDSSRGQSRQSFYRGSTDGSVNRDGSINRDGGDRNRAVDQVFRDRDRREGDLSRRDGDRDRRDGDRRDIDRDRLTGDRNRFDGDRDRDRDRFDRDRNRGDWWRTADRIRSDWGRRDRDDFPFRFGWWDHHWNDRWPVYFPWRFAHWRDRPWYWWGWTPAPNLVTWFVWDWNRPRYWAYGPGGNIYYQDDYVYYDGDQYLPVDDYYQRMYDLAHSVPQIDPRDAEQMDWAPLGVFAAVPDGQANDASQRTLQLAVNRDGVITGTYYSGQRDEVHPVTGMVDERTQRAAWAFADGTNPKTVFETSIFNLTKSESTMMVHFGPGPGDTEVWHLVRMERPEGTTAEMPAPARSVNQLP
jgi:hypothetical protein